MALNTLPIDASAPAYTVDTDMDGVVYRLTVEWNTRGEFWTLGLGLPDGTIIAAGQPLRIDWQPFLNIGGDLMPPGRITVVDTTGVGTDPAYDDLGSRVLVMYDDEL